MKINKKHIFLGIGAVILIFIIQYIFRLYQASKKIDYRLKNFDLKFKGINVEANLDYEIVNPTSTDINISTFFLKIFSPNGKEMGVINTTSFGEIPANSMPVITLPMETTLSQIVSGLAGGGTQKIILRGHMRVNKLFLVPIDQEYEFGASQKQALIDLHQKKLKA